MYYAAREGTMVENRDAILTVRLRPAEKALLQSAAAQCGERTSTWLRQVAVEAARRDVDRTTESADA